MCCNRIDTDTILANLFAVTDGEARGYTLPQIEKYFTFLVESWPCYVSTDFSKQEIYACVRRYPELYRVSRESEEEEHVQPGTLRPSLAFFNAGFSESANKYLKEISMVYMTKLKREGLERKKEEKYPARVQLTVRDIRPAVAQR